MRQLKVTYKINLVSKNEGIDYVDDNGIYRFNVSLNHRIWTLYLPGSYGDSYKSHHLTKTEREVIIPRITEYLEQIKWFGLFKFDYSVQVVEINHNVSRK